MRQIEDQTRIHYTMQFANINGHLLHYKHMHSNEEKQTFVFINSVGTGFRIWEDVADALKEQANILLFDNRGHGLSDVVEDTTGLDDFVKDSLTLLDQLSIKKCIVIGLSLGGMVAMLMANRFSNKIEKLILCDTGYTIGHAQFWNERIAIVEEQGIAAVSNSVMPRWFSESFINAETIKMKGYKNMLERTPVIGYMKACEAIRDANLKEIAADINLPVLCVVGSEDKSTTPADVKALSDVIKGSKYAVIGGSGHLPCVDNPQALSKLILEFVNS